MESIYRETGIHEVLPMVPIRCMFVVQTCLLALQQPNYGSKSSYADDCMLLKFIL
jgi:hypothetical protein